MAHHASAKKALRQSLKNNERNKARTSEMRTFIKKALAAIEAKDLEAAKEVFKLAQSKIMMAAKKNIIKKNAASRKVSRLASKIKSIEVAA